ncbi:MAG: ribonuclease R [Sedimentisphaerales bacterium]|jgi:ribonuclease R|nr:ribonuclease R [Planctomycetota bacterium]MDY0357014.1 ribonuclease R [Sedimentisphaerales bacterium]NLT77878.1 ribonuclease R [Planctomycetota bacterium]
MHDVLKSHILHLLQKDATPRNLAHLAEELGVSGSLRGAFREAVESLGAEGRVILGPRNTIALPSLSSEVTGVFRANPRGYGFVSPQQFGDEGEVFIPAKATGSAMTGDRVVAQVTRGSKADPDRLTGRIVKVLDRAHTTVVGTLRQEQDRWQVRPDGGDFLRPIEIEGLDTRTVRHGDKVAVAIRTYPTRSEAATGTIREVLGRPGRFDAETSAIIRRHGLLEEFEPSALVEASNARENFRPQPSQGRKDITDALVVTIDPPDAQDFDDAISLTRTRQGGWHLGVHIADVSHFVPTGSALDRCARQRGNSVYLPGRTLPMLPEMLSNEICSLQPGKRRYTKSVYLTYNKDGQMQSVRFANTMIESKARLSYQQADAALKGHTGGLADDVVALLGEMDTLARVIEKRRRRAGMLQLKMPETDLVTDESGQVVGVRPADTSYPHTIIEMFMVEANVAVATLLDRYCVPFMRRVHPEPDGKVLNRLSQTLRLLGVTLSRRPQRGDLQALLDQVQGSRMSLPVNLLVLRSLAKATYAPASIGHYALAASKYCHFTSPIRRYADLIVHRALQAYLTGQLDRARRQYTFPELAAIGEHISETEQTADEAEHELRTILILGLLQQKVGSVMDGVVVSLTRFGAAVHLGEYGVEGLIPCEALGPDRWRFDEQSQCLVGRHTGSIVRLAQPLRVRIVAVAPAGEQLDLAPAVDLIRKVPDRDLPQRPGRGDSGPRRRRKRKPHA